MKTVEWSHASRKILKRIDKNLSMRIIDAMDRFASLGLGDVKKLRGSEEYRLRVGDWRVRFLADEAVLVVVSIKPRGGAYR